jgi:hypothetical protein
VVALAFLAGLTLSLHAASAIVVRHDLEPQAYLASDSRFPALLALYRTSKVTATASPR